MAEDQSFEDLRSLYAEKLARVQGMIAEKSDAERPVLEKRLIEIQTQVQHMQPLGLRSSTLSETPSEGGIYSEANIDASQRERLTEPDLRSRIDAALHATGISTSEVVARIETGASSAALEHQWIADDLSKVAEARGMSWAAKRRSVQERGHRAKRPADEGYFHHLDRLSLAAPLPRVDEGLLAFRQTRLAQR